MLIGISVGYGGQGFDNTTVIQVKSGKITRKGVNEASGISCSSTLFGDDICARMKKASFFLLKPTSCERLIRTTLEN